MTVTLFNRLGEDETGRANYKVSVFRGAVLEAKRASNPVNTGERDNDNFRLYLFTDRGYLEPEDFRTHPQGHWTIAPGDLTAPGIHAEPPARPYRINTVNPFYAGERFHHWEGSGRGQLLES